MKARPVLRVVDLYCGVGGTSQALYDAAELLGYDVRLVAINHSPVAIASHAANHPHAEHVCANVESTNPFSVMRMLGGLVDILIATCSCVHHSNARGGKPRDEQLRYSPFDVLHWVELLRPRLVMLENVKEFCLPADTLVWTESGLLPIQDVKVGTRVLTHRGRWRAVKATMSRKADTVIIKGTGNSILECTDNHPVYARKIGAKCWGGQRGRHAKVLSDPEWVPAKDLVPNKDRMSTYRKLYSGFFYAAPRVFPEMQIPYFTKANVEGDSIAFWRMIGLWLGDGWFRKRRGRYDGLRICANHGEDSLVEAQLNETGINWNRQVRASVVVFEATNSELAQWLAEHFGEYADGKTIPAWALGLDDASKIALIEGYAQADGHMQKKDSRQNAITVSKKLALGLKAILETIGIPANIGRYRLQLQARQLKDGRKIIPKKQTYWLTWKWKDRASAFYRDDDLHHWTKVRKVEAARQHVTVYDLTVEEDHSFVADGVVVHNCTWGPLDEEGRVIKSLKGQTYYEWLRRFRSLGYAVDSRVLNAADWGDTTCRSRWICLAARADQHIERVGWPETTHSRHAGQPGFEHFLAWEGAYKIIDWKDMGASIYDRRKPLAPTTMSRIMVGVEKFCGDAFLIGAGGPQGAGRPRSLRRPLNTLLTENHKALVQPVLTTTDVMAEPMGTPFLLTYHGHHRGRSDGDNRVRSICQPLGTLDTSNRFALVSAFLLKYNSTGGPRPVSVPLGTLTTKPRYGLVTSGELTTEVGDTYLDIRFRMLKPAEQAAAHSFPSGYVLAGTVEDQTRLLGNSVPRYMARAVFLGLLGRPDVRNVLSDAGLLAPAPPAFGYPNFGLEHVA